MAMMKVVIMFTRELEDDDGESTNGDDGDCGDGDVKKVMMAIVVKIVYEGSRG